MNQISKVEIPVEAATAAALVDTRRLEAVGRLVDRLVRTGADDPLFAVMERSATEAGLSEAEIAAELGVYNLENTAPRNANRPGR